jgi:GcrA cell cycle regulator
MKHTNGATCEFWTAERTEKLTALWLADEMSTAQIAQVLGCTKNAVIGKSQRICLPAKRVGARPKDHAPWYDQLGRGCMYPTGHTHDATLKFCGQEVTRLGSPYCDLHHAVCWTRVPVKNPKPPAPTQISMLMGSLADA